MPRERVPPDERLRRNVTASGRPRSSDEQLFTRALIEQLEIEMERRGLDQRGLAELLGKHESLLSMYFSGQRLPSLPALFEFDRAFPGFLTRVVRSWNLQVDRKERPRSPHTQPKDKLPELPGQSPGQRDEILSFAALLG